MKQEVVAPAGTDRRLDFVLPCIALAIYFALAFPLRGWIVDDAAISMAYAKHWTEGYGLVAQPGFPPVEGYSNFLWVVLLAGLKLVGGLSVAGVKALALLCVSLSVASIDATTKQMMSPGARAVMLLLVATNASLVTWGSSGLENPLTLLIACELLRMAFHRPSVRSAVYTGALVACLGMNRPEGIAFVVFPLTFLWGRWRLLAIYGAVVATIYGAFLGFRFATFGDWVPNTFHAKVTMFSWIYLLANAIDVMKASLGFVAVLPAVLFAVYFTARDDNRILFPLAFMCIAGGLFVLMPPDWMPQARFGTAFMPAAFLFVGLTLRRYVWALAIVLAVSAGFSIVRLQSVYREPTVPADTVIGYSQRFERIAPPGASLMMPDIGGALLTSKLRIYDLAGLIDPTVARTLVADKQRFHDYVFGELKPTFIKTHSGWTRIAQFDADPRFRRDYEQIGDGEYVRRGTPLHEDGR